MGTKNLLYAILASYVAIAIMVGVCIWYTNYVRDENNRQWCDLLSPLDKAYSSQVPATKLGRTVAKSIHNLHDNFGC